ncbi:TlpA family protein disulfide reductase [Nonomuraea rubra]
MRTSPRRWITALACAAAIATAVSACAGQQTDSSQLRVSGATVASKALRPDQRTITPELRGTDLDGRPFDVAALRGKVVVVNYWGSWCAPCRAETPALIRAARQAEPLGVAFAGVNIRDRKASAQAFAREYAVPYPSLFDPSMRSALAFGPMAPRALPATYVLDRRGRVAAFFYGAVTEESLLAVLRGIAAEPGASAGATPAASGG